MTIPDYINEDRSEMRCIKPGWYATDDDGKLSSGRFPVTRNASVEALS